MTVTELPRFGWLTTGKKQTLLHWVLLSPESGNVRQLCGAPFVHIDVNRQVYLKQDHNLPRCPRCAKKLQPCPEIEGEIVPFQRVAE